MCVYVYSCMSNIYMRAFCCLLASGSLSNKASKSIGEDPNRLPNHEIMWVGRTFFFFRPAILLQTLFDRLAYVIMNRGLIGISYTESEYRLGNSESIPMCMPWECEKEQI